MRNDIFLALHDQERVSEINVKMWKLAQNSGYNINNNNNILHDVRREKGKEKRKKSEENKKLKKIKGSSDVQGVCLFMPFHKDLI